MEATSASGAIVTFAAAATDAFGASEAVSFTENGSAVRSGATFSLGEHYVLASADVTSPVGIDFKVVDTTPPSITIISAPSAPVQANSAQGAAVTFAASALDAVDGTEPVSFTEKGQAVQSGSIFSVGSHEVVVTATDEAGNTGTNDIIFSVVGRVPAATLLKNLISLQSSKQYGGVLAGVSDDGSYNSAVARALASAISTELSNGSLSFTGGSAPATGNGVLVINTPNTSVSLQRGVTVALVAGGTGSVAVQGSGDTNQVLMGDDENITYNTGGGTGTVVTGDGDNLIGTPNSGGGAFSIVTGAGNDVILVLTGTNTVSAGAGNNTIFTGSGTNTVYAEGSDLITGVGGAAGTLDTVFQTGGSSLIGEFQKNLMFVGGVGTATVLAGSGSYTVNGGIGANLIAGGTAGNNFLGGGTGSRGSTIFGGGDGDIILARGSGTNLAVAGSGNETLTGAQAAGDNIFFAALGAASSTSNTSIQGGSGNDTYFVGSGRSTVDAGLGGNDIIAIVNGRAGGSVVVNNFQPGTQQVQLQGYGASEVTNALSTQQMQGGSAVLTLSDNTTITFTGVAQVGQSFFG